MEACPERALALGVIMQAAVDLRTDRALAPDARRFLSDGRLDWWCDQIELRPEFARECIETWLAYDFKAVA